MDFLTAPAADAVSTSASASGLAAGQTSNGLPRKTRLACNRCHTQKLRCIKSNGQISCERCLKLKRSCKYSPRAPRASVKQSEPAIISSLDGFHELLPTTASALTPNEHVNPTDSSSNGENWSFPSSRETVAVEEDTLSPEAFFDMSDLNFPFLFPELPNLDSPCQDAPALSNMPPGNESDMVRFESQGGNDSFAQSQLSPIQKLATLNVGLHECAQNLPTVTQSDRGHAAGLGSRKATIFAIDDLLRLTAEFIELTRCLSNETYLSSSAISSIQPIRTDSEHQLSLPDFYILPGESVSSTTQEPPTKSCSQVDEATMSLIFSCHCRMSEIYVSLFQMMQDCIVKSLGPQLGSNWAVILPRLQVGSISSSPVRVDINTPILSKASSAMYMLMITTLSSHLWEQIADLVRLGAPIPTGSPSASFSSLAEMMRGTMEDRTASLLQTIEATKHILEQ